jgi:sarcosine oxidase
VHSYNRHVRGVEVIVVGAGVMGAATASALARAGRRVVLLEQFETGHKRGSSHGTSRIFRLSYPDPLYVGMAQEALALWRELEGLLGERLLLSTGGLDAGGSVDAHVSALSERGIEYEVLAPQEACARWPFLRFDRAGPPVLYQRDSGILLADRAVRGLAGAAVAAGAELSQGTRAIELHERSDGVDVVTSQGQLGAEAVVVTAGPWAKPLLWRAGIEVPTRVTRETVGYFHAPETFPPTVVEWGTPAVYALPAPGQGLKAGEHQAGPTVDPDSTPKLDRESLARVEAWVARRYAGASAPPHRAETCLYTNAPNESFVLERHGRVVVGSACSGHGFKFAPLIGHRLAALAAEVLSG